MIPILDGCQNDECRKIAITTIQAVNVETGKSEESLDVCAYCRDGFTVPEGYRIEEVE